MIYLLIYRYMHVNIYICICLHTVVYMLCRDIFKIECSKSDFVHAQEGCEGMSWNSQLGFKV